MQKHFPHILKQLISPQTIPSHPGGVIGRYMANRQNLKYIKNLWPQTNKQLLIQQGVNLRRQLQQAIDQEDRVLLLKVCSIPLYNRLQHRLRQKQLEQKLSLGSWGYHFEMKNIYKIGSNNNNVNNSNNTNQQQKQSPSQSSSSPTSNNNNNLMNTLLATKPSQWIRVQFTYKEQLKNNNLIDRQLWIERKVDEDQLGEKKWYIYQIGL